MPLEFSPGDYLVFQLESGFGILRILHRDDSTDGLIWHIAVYSDLFLDVESIENSDSWAHDLSVAIPHVAMTNRSFESTQVAFLANIPLSSHELIPLEKWRSDPDRAVVDRSVRLMLGLR